MARFHAFLWWLRWLCLAATVSITSNMYISTGGAVWWNNRGKHPQEVHQAFYNKAALKFEQGSSSPRLQSPDWEPYVVDPDEIKVLVCDVISHAPFTVSWYKNGEQLQPGNDTNYQFEANGQHFRLTNTKQEDSGTYRCQANNRFGKSRPFEGSIEVRGSPYIVGPKILHMDYSPVKVMLGSEFNLTCVIFQGEATFKLRVWWLHEGERVSDTWRHEYNQQVRGGEMTATLMLRNITKSDLGVYTCEAINNVVATGNVTLEEYEAPPGEGNGNIIFVLTSTTSVAVVAVALLVAGLVYKVRHKKTYLPSWWDPNHFDLPQAQSKYDVFISYSSKDGDWVRSQLLAQLENQGYQVCVDFKEFIPGKPIVANIIDGIYCSRRTLVIMSDNFLSSNFARFELQTAHCRVFDTRENLLVLVKLDNCLIPGELRGVTYLDKTDEHIQPHFWVRLFEALGEPQAWTQTSDDDSLVYQLPSSSEDEGDNIGHSYPPSRHEDTARLVSLS